MDNLIKTSLMDAYCEIDGTSDVSKSFVVIRTATEFLQFLKISEWPPYRYHVVHKEQLQLDLWIFDAVEKCSTSNAIKNRKNIATCQDSICSEHFQEHQFQYNK